jgi:DNA-binding MarR family transcriptional regulator
MKENRDVIGCVMRLMRTLKRTHKPDRHESRGAGRLLRVLASEDGLTSRELAERVEIRPASLTERLNQLEADGIVKRVPDEKDQRKVRIFIQEEGYRVIERFKVLRQMENDRINEVLTEEEQDVFCSICEKLTKSMEGFHEEGGGVS